MSQGLLIVVLGIGLIYLVLSGKLDCLIAAFRACAGTSQNSAANQPNGIISGGAASSAKSTVGTILNPAT